MRPRPPICGEGRSQYGKTPQRLRVSVTIAGQHVSKRRAVVHDLLEIHRLPDMIIDAGAERALACLPLGGQHRRDCGARVGKSCGKNHGPCRAHARRGNWCGDGADNRFDGGEGGVGLVYGADQARR